MAQRPEIEPGLVRGEFFTHLDDGGLRCDLCPRLCTLRDGQRGFCFVRQARGDEIVLTTYGRSTGFCIDPIEKKPLNHFYPGTPILSFGTAGCNLGCRFCQNWESSKARQVELMLAQASPEAIAEHAERAGCRSVAYTYNEPIIFHEYAIDTAAACHERGLANVAVTAGYITSEARPRFFEHMDGANVDLKAFSERFYHDLCAAKLDPVLDTLRYLGQETDVWFEVTTLIIPGENDGEDEIARMCDWLVDNLGPNVPLHFSAFHPDFKLMDTPRTPTTTLSRARAQAQAAGLKFVYTGNVHDPAGQSTRCPSCDHLLVERDWYQIGAWGLTDSGACAGCGAAVPGRFAGGPGDWGTKRQRLTLSR